MRSSTRTYVASALLGSTLVYAVPQRLGSRSFERFPIKRTPLDAAIGVAEGDAPPASPDPNMSQQATPNASVSADAVSLPTSTQPAGNSAATTIAQVYDTVTTSESIHSTSGSRPNTADSAYSNASSSTVHVASAPSITPSLAPEPTVESSNGHGVLTGVVVGCLVLGFIILTLSLWFCYRRRGSRSGSSTPIYTTKVVGDDKPRGIFAFLRGSGQRNKGHHRVQSSMSFASPMIGNEPKMMEQAQQQAPLAPHLSGSTWNGRWSTFSTSDGSAYPQTPVGTTRLSGIIMETVVETDDVTHPRTPTMGPRQTPIDYTDLKRSSNDALLNRTPKKTSLTSQLPPLGTNRLSMFREEDSMTPTTPTSSGGLTFGSGSNYARTIDRSSLPPIPPAALTTHTNGSGGSLRSGPLINAVPKFNPAHSNGSGSVSTSRESDGTIRITNPFLDDEDGLSSYGHGMVEADDSRSIQTMDSDAYGAYPSSNGCIPKPGPSPSPDAPLTRPRSSLISDASSDYPYPLGYAMDSDGNVANPFLRISEILEEVDGRMRWPSPPLLTRQESRDY